jgi:hypothetical protein
MPKRPAAWCPADAHVWERGPQVLLHLPAADGSARELFMRWCTRCPLAEALHVTHLGGNGRLEAWEHWWIEADATVPGWQHTDILWDKGKEATSYLG